LKNFGGFSNWFEKIQLTSVNCLYVYLIAQIYNFFKRLIFEKYCFIKFGGSCSH
jgi:hypothetical protein